jgi:hypothetical protein
MGGRGCTVPPSSILQEEVPYPKRLSLSLSSSSSRRELACQRRHAEPGLACSGQSCAAGAGARLTRQDKVVQVSARISCADDTGFEKSVWKCSLQRFSVAACTHLCGPFPAKRGAAAACNACSPHLMLRTLVQTRPEHAGALLAPTAKPGYWHMHAVSRRTACIEHFSFGVDIAAIMVVAVP